MAKFQKKNLILAIFFGVLFILLFLALPMTMDDWAWGSEAGLQRLKNGFSGYNGRYLGNLLTLAITRSRALRGIFMSVVAGLLTAQLSRLAGLNSLFGRLAAGCLLFSCIFTAVLGPKANLFDQTLGWTSGFTNYVVPTALLLIYLNYTLKCEKAKNYEAVLLFVLAVSVSLFVEHITLFNLSFSLLVNLYFMFCKKEINRAQSAYFAGSVVGAAIMFTNSAYTEMLKNSGNTERDIGFIGKGALAKISSESGFSPRVLTLFAVIAVFGFAAALLIPFFAAKSKTERIGLLLPAVISLMLTVPLLFANGGEHAYLFTPRVYFPHYVMICVYILRLAKIIFCKTEKTKPFLRKAISVFCAALVIFYSVLYIGIFKVDFNLRKTIEAQRDTERTMVDIIEYPEKYDRFVYMSDIYKQKDWSAHFRNYYKIPKDKNLRVIN